MNGLPLWCISVFFYTYFIIYSWNKISDEKYNFKKYHFKNGFLPNIIVSFILVIFSLFVPQPIRFFASNISLFIMNYIFINKNIKKIIISTALTQVIINVSEVLFILLASIIVGNKLNDLFSNYYFLSLMNLCILVIAFILFKTSVFFKSLIKNINKMNHKESIIYSIAIIIIMIITTIETHMKVSMPILLITNTVVALLFILLVFKITKEKERYAGINNKYQTSVTSLKEYEKMIDKFRIETHENKNELLIIRNMTKNKKVIKYIDELIGNKIKDNEKIMRKTAKIPEGGIRATIYSKMCVMDRYDIKYVLEISTNVKTVDLINIDDNLMIDLCKILCIFLDNAIEEVKNLEDRMVTIEIYKIDNNIMIDITNNYKGDIQINKMGTKKYTKKGENHGYGLALVNQIIEKNDNYLENDKYINGNTFTQSIKIKGI